MTSAPLTLLHLMAASAIIETLRKIVSADRCTSDEEEEAFRRLIARAERAFGFGSVAERPANTNADPDMQLSAVVLEMEREPRSIT